jgi:hypothetical protein
MKTTLAVTFALCLFAIPAAATPTSITLEWDLYPNETTATVYGKYAFLAAVDQDPEHPSLLDLPYVCEDATRTCQAQISVEVGSHTIALRTFRRSDGAMSAPTTTISFIIEDVVVDDAHPGRGPRRQKS